MDSKNWLASKGVWGSVVAMAAGLSAFAGVDLTAPVQTEIVDILAGIGGLVGGAISLYGRVVAVTKLVWSTKQ